MEEAFQHALSHAGNDYCILYNDPNVMFDMHNSYSSYFHDAKAKPVFDRGKYGYEVITLFFPNHSVIQMMWVGNMDEIQGCTNWFFMKRQIENKYVDRYLYVNDVDQYRRSLLFGMNNVLKKLGTMREPLLSAQALVRIKDLYIGGCCCPPECNESCFDLDKESCDIAGCDLSCDYAKFKEEYAVKLDIEDALCMIYDFVKDMSFVDNTEIVSLGDNGNECCKDCDMRSHGCCMRIGDMLYVRRTCPYYAEFMVESLN